MGSIHEKNHGQKSHATVPLSTFERTIFLVKFSYSRLICVIL
jgi:hypothetical protein